jgi:hypothetical protein
MILPFFLSFFFFHAIWRQPLSLKDIAGYVRNNQATEAFGAVHKSAPFFLLGLCRRTLVRIE